MPWLRACLAALAELALPVTCAACARPGEGVCRECRAGLHASLWTGGPRLARPDPCPPGLPAVHASGRYEGPLARLLSAYKDDGRRDCAALLGAALGVCLQTALAASPGATAALGRDDGPVLVIPVPSSRAARRRRGDAPLLALCAIAVEGFGAGEVVVADALRQRRLVADQAGLGAQARAANLEHAIEVRRRWEPSVVGAVCVLADDVLTTGSTLAEAARAVRSAGAGQVLAVTICATQRRPT